MYIMASCSTPRSTSTPALLKNLAQQVSSLTLTSRVTEDLIDHVLTGCFVATEANDFVKADAGLSFTNHAERSHIVRFPE